MGQDTKYIITTEILNVPINIIHFKENNALVFPILLEDSDFVELSNYSKKSTVNVYEFFDNVLHGGYYLEYPIKNLMRFIQSSKIKSLALISYREFLDLPQDTGFPILFINDKIVNLSTTVIAEPEIGDIENECHKLLNSDIHFNEIINNEDKYWSYEESETYYLNNLKNSH
jgi:hypothetical protein